ncbi:MAG: lysophospholipid acyltransferase family protein [Deltaproteobacteria bacterium]
MHWFKKSIYNLVKNSVKIYLKTFLEFRVWGKENIPAGPKIFCSNHFSSSDLLFVITLIDEPVHMVIGPGFKLPVIRWFLKAGEQINALYENRKDVVNNAVEYLSKGESIYIFPEGDLNNQNELLEFYHGVSKIQLASKCPVVPIGIIAPKRYVKERKANIKIEETVYKTLVVMTGKYYANIGTPLYFDDKDYSFEKITSLIKEKIIFLINDIKTNKFWS